VLQTFKVLATVKYIAVNLEIRIRTKCEL